MVYILTSFWISILRFWNFVLVWLGLRGPHHFWGVIYDSVTKQPLDPVVVKLISAGNFSEIQTCITDLSGHYGFLVSPGKYKIFAKKDNYIFPSKKIKSFVDDPYEEIYHGEFFEVLGESVVIAPNIPMDPMNFDWNQEAKLKYENQFPFWRVFFRQLISIFFWFFLIIGFLLTLDQVLKNKLFSDIRPIYVFAFGILMLILNSILPHIRLWGRIYIKSKSLLDSKFLLELSHKELPTIIFTKTYLANDGKFFMRAKPGRYILTIKRILESGGNEIMLKKSIVVHSEGVVNISLRI